MEPFGIINNMYVFSKRCNIYVSHALTKLRNDHYPLHSRDDSPPLTTAGKNGGELVRFNSNPKTQYPFLPTRKDVVIMIYYPGRDYRSYARSDLTEWTNF